MMASGAAPTPQMKIQGSRRTGARWLTPKNQLSGVGAGATEQRAQRGPVHALCTLRTPTYAAGVGQSHQGPLPSAQKGVAR